MNKFSSMTSGFTIVELLIVIVVTSIAMGAIYTVYVSVSQNYSSQREIANMQQNIRSAMYLIKSDLRNAGRNPLMDGSVGITNVGRFNPDADDPNGYPGITMTTLFDNDNDGEADSGSQRTISYRVADVDNDLRRELWRRDSNSANPLAWDLVFDGIEDIGFAYAFDADNDLDLDRSAVAAGAGTVMWAIDTDNIIGLDTNVDNVPDGDINALDDGDGDGLINNADGGLGVQIPLRDIRAVRIWILARSRQAFPNYTDSNTYVLGRKVMDMLNDPLYANRRNFRHKLLVGAVAMQNRQRTP
jgi:type IV pilus assembly protein PilW